MCTVVFAWQVFDDCPLVLVANRDESVDRPSDPPLHLQTDPPLWGGRDRVAGGTWLAVDPRGRICAVTNRHPGGRLPDPDPGRESRGQIPTAVLGGGDDASAVATMQSWQSADFNPVNALYVSATRAFWIGLDDEGGRQEAPLAPGVHVLTEQNPDDPSSRKASGLLRDAQGVASLVQTSEALLAEFRALLQSHHQYSDGPESAACIHEEKFGTVSSATVQISRGRTWFAHADGHPCTTPYQAIHC